MKRIYLSILVFLMACSFVYVSSVQADSLIFDGAHSGNPNVFFLPPIVSNPNNHPSFDAGKFDPTLSPTVEICLIQNNACSPNQPDGFPLIFNFGMGSDSVRVNADEENYITNWYIDESGSESSAFRISVLVEGVLLGFTDILLLSSMKEAKNLDSGEIFTLIGGELPIKFRIEEDATDWRIAGPEGGILQFGNGVVFDVPAGAVDQYVAIRLGDIPFSEVQKLLDDRAYRSSEKYVLAGFFAEPHGLVFNVPIKATLSIPTPIGVPMHAEVDLDEKIYWISKTDLIYDPETGLAEFTLTNFSGHITVDVAGMDIEVPSWCSGRRIRVISDYGGFSGGNGCQVLSDYVEVTFLSCPGQPTQKVRISETTPECKDDFKLTPVISPAALQVCRSQKLEATVIDHNNNVWEVPLRWISNDPSIVDFDQKIGTAVGKKEGSVLVKAVTPDPRFSGETIVSISAASPIIIQPINPEVKVGDTISLSAYDDVKDSYKCDVLLPDGKLESKNVTWSTVDTSIADVDPHSGLVTGVSPGYETVTARCGYAEPSSTTVKVVEDPGNCDLSLTIAYTEVTGWPDGFVGRIHEKNAAITLETGWTLQFEVKAEDYLVRPPRNPIPQCLSDEWVWTSRDESIATVDQKTGLVTAVGLGLGYLRVEHAQHPEIWAEAVVNVVESWLDQFGDGIIDKEFYLYGYLCSVGPNYLDPFPCDGPEDPSAPRCPSVIVLPGQKFECDIAINPYTDPNLDCVPPNVAGVYDTPCENYTVVERRESWVGFSESLPPYFERPITYRNEEAMQYWWLDW